MGEGINMPAPGVGAVYGAMAKATRMLAAIGVDKSSQNAAQGFNFRGIDAVLGAMSKVLVECGLFILPTVEDHAITMLVDDKSKKTKFRAQVTVGYHITSVEDSSRVHTCVCAEAIDSQDKATSKALSMAYKYFAFQTFCIPLKGCSTTRTQTARCKKRALYRCAQLRRSPPTTGRRNLRRPSRIRLKLLHCC